MFGSIFIGLSGMNAYSNGLRQISNNITNLNSLGFKSSNLLFGAQFGVGSAQSDQIGQGVALSSARLDFAQGELRQSDKDLDLAIDGRGFLVLLKDAEMFFARTGSFEVNEDGDIVLAGTDYKLTALDEAGRPVAISIQSQRISQPQKTTTITFGDNLSSSATTFQLPSVKVFNAQGESENWSIGFERTATSPPGEWSVVVKNASGAEVGRQTLKFIGGIVDPATTQLTFEDTTTGRSATLDFSKNVTSFSSGEVSTLRVASSDGFGIGELTGVTIDENGNVSLAYSNEQKKSLGAVSLANFRDIDALTQMGNGLFETRDGVAIDYLPSSREEIGKVVSRRLEASNVDLSQEFGDLILVQRGYQASSQVVSVSNEMIQQLFGIRGQG
jgi:flagellar hook protein FlgE